ncbi:MAG: polysulfide reductase, partial [Actinobacteria bacterium]|nr:polysulfide reductase [Actinomycetota bacterium]
AAGAGAAGVLLTPPAAAGPARRLLGFGAALELAGGRAMEHRLGPLAGPYRTGSAARPRRAATALTAAGALLAAGCGARRPVAGRAGAVMVMAGAALTRWSVFRAGFDSASDPRYTVTSQRQA